MSEEDYEIPHEELGPFSPLIIECNDRYPSIQDMSIAKPHISLIKRFLEDRDISEKYTQEEKDILFRMDLYLDLPKVILLQNISKEKQLKYLISKKYNKIQQFVSQNDLLNKDCPLYKYGAISVLEWLDKHGYYWTCNAFEGACYYGQLDLLKWLCKQKHSSLNKRSVELAIKQGHLNILKWIYSRYPTLICYSLYKRVIDYDQVHILEWMITISQYYHISSIYNSNSLFKQGKVKTIEFFVNRGDIRLTSSSYILPIEYKQTKVLKWLIDHNCPVNLLVLRSAIYYNNIYMIKWFNTHKKELTEQLYHEASLNQDQEINQQIMKWLEDSENGYKKYFSNINVY